LEKGQLDISQLEEEAQRNYGASTLTGKKNKNRDIKKANEKKQTEPTGAQVKEPIEKKAVRKKT
jgi:hypothetical protein